MYRIYGSVQAVMKTAEIWVEYGKAATVISELQATHDAQASIAVLCCCEPDTRNIAKAADGCTS
jgi:hypothetical protein